MAAYEDDLPPLEPLEGAGGGPAAPASDGEESGGAGEKRKAGDELLEGARKKRKPRPPPLSSTQLLGERGLPALLKGFPGSLRLRGAPYETKDLQALMAAYSEWAFRMYPHKALANVLRNVADLGQRRAVAARVNEMRMGKLMRRPEEFVEADRVALDEELDDGLDDALAGVDLDALMAAAAEQQRKAAQQPPQRQQQQQDEDELDMLAALQAEEEERRREEERREEEALADEMY